MKRFPNSQERWPRWLGVAVLVALSASAGAEEKPKPKGGPEEFKYLAYRLVGPAAGGRVSRAVGVPGDRLTYYAGVSAGGVWKSADAGATWKPIFDDQPISSIGSIAVAPSDPNVVYVGSGEANIRGNVGAGNGIYKSTDAGKTWTHVWKQEGQIGSLVVHPRNPDVAYAAVLGHAFGPNPERGVYRTTDGGKTWKQVLAKNPDTGASDVCLDPSNPRILFAGMWQTRRRPWELASGGPGSGLYISRDGGDTWKQLGGAGVGEDDLHGLPKGIYGKVGVAVAPSDGRRVYALIENEKGGLYRSDDGGESWKLASGHHALRQRAWYYSTLTIDPRNPDIVWCPQVRLLKSIDGGQTFKKVKGTHHGDHHDIWIDPYDSKRMINSNDGGVDLTWNGGETWFAPPLPISQFYHVAADNRKPYHVMGNMQDLGSASGPSNSLSSGGISICDWTNVGGGETGFTVPDPADPDIVYSGEYGGYLSRYDQRTRQAENISIYPTNPSGHGAEDLRYRFQWTAPVLVSSHDHNVIYHAANVLFRTTDRGVRWKAISPDLTRNDRTKQKWSGGPITGDNTGAEYYDTIFALAESPRQEGVLWAGSDDGLVHVTQDGGKTWTNVTQNVPGIPEWGTVDCVEPSLFDAATAYLVVDNHRMDDMHPYLYKTTDFGKTWKSLATGLPQDVYLHAVREDPKRKGMLYVGTERGVAFSRDDGATWQQLKLNLPTVAVHDLVVKDNDLVVGTTGRSIWIFDDLTPIREYAKRLAEQEVHLFGVQPSIRWRYHAPVYSTQDRHAPENPARGAYVNYYLKKKPKDPITLEVLDAEGRTVRKLSSKEPIDEVPEDDPDAPYTKPEKVVLSVHPGVNRVVWSHGYDGPHKIAGVKIDNGDLSRGPLVTPGTYVLKLTVEGKTLTGTAVVTMDPRVKVPADELVERLQFALKVRDDISHVARRVEALRSIRTQLTSLRELEGDNPKAADLVKQAKELITKLDDLESRWHNPKAEVTYDILAQPGGAKLYSLLAAVLEFLKDSDGPITEGLREEYAREAQDLHAYDEEFAKLTSEQLRQINELARKLDVPTVVVPRPKTDRDKRSEAGKP
jgi:photosystem II stability/assembly factor-like uncharacterized protein